MSLVQLDNTSCPYTLESLGVPWNTVGSLGVPWGVFEWDSTLSHVMDAFQQYKGLGTRDSNLQMCFSTVPVNGLIVWHLNLPRNV